MRKDIVPNLSVRNSARVLLHVRSTSYRDFISSRILFCRTRVLATDTVSILFSSGGGSASGGLNAMPAELIAQCGDDLAGK